MKKNIPLLYGFSFFDQLMVSSAFRATVISMANLGIRASFSLLGPLVGYGIDRWGLPLILQESRNSASGIRASST